MANNFHAADGYPSKRGCDGIDKCNSCMQRVAATASQLQTGAAYALPFHTLFVWDDGSYSTLTRINPELN